jgi:predicted phosphodiesterase
VPLRIAAVIVAGLLAGLGALWTFSAQRDLSAGRVAVSVSPLHHGALDVYVPVVDWGVRFDGVRLPARLRLEVRSVDRRAASRLADGDPARVDAVLGEARDAVASYLRALTAVLILRAPVRLLGAGLVAMAAWAAAIAFLLAPRGPLDQPQYYAHGPDIPVALRAVQQATRSSSSLGQYVDDQLVGLARLVAPGRRTELRDLPRLTIASDLHNNVLALDALRRAAQHGPVLFPGDLTDSGTQLETAVLRQVVGVGRPFVFTTGNHDSDTLAQALARRGAVVLTQTGRLRADGSRGPVVASVAGLRVAGYASPNERLSRDGYRDNGADVTLQEQAAFEHWLLGLAGHVDIVLVHEPQLAAPAMAAWRLRHPDDPLLIAVGHTHHQSIDADGSVVAVNGGTLGAGGTGNLDEGQDVGLAVATVRRHPFSPVAIDLVQIDPGDGSATASRTLVGS